MTSKLHFSKIKKKKWYYYVFVNILSYLWWTALATLTILHSWISELKHCPLSTVVNFVQNISVTVTL